MILSLYNSIDKQCVKLRSLYLLMILDQKATPSPPAGGEAGTGQQKHAPKPVSLFCTVRSGKRRMRNEE